MKESQGHQNDKKLKYVGCNWTRVVVKAETKSANHSNFSTNRSNSTILFTIQLSDKFLICSYDFIVAKELNMPRYRRQKRHCRCVGALKLARARPFGSFKTIEIVGSINMYLYVV